MAVQHLENVFICPNADEAFDQVNPRLAVTTPPHNAKLDQHARGGDAIMKHKTSLGKFFKMILNKSSMLEQRKARSRRESTLPNTSADDVAPQGTITN